jgi:hypothetical protein
MESKMPETIIERYAEYICLLDMLRRESSEMEEKMRGVHKAEDLPSDQRAGIRLRLVALHDGVLRPMTDYSEVISQEEYKWLEDRLETTARMIAVIDGQDTV